MFLPNCIETECATKMRFFHSLEVRSWRLLVLLELFSNGYWWWPQNTGNWWSSGSYWFQTSPNHRPRVGTGSDRDLRRGWILIPLIPLLREPNSFSWSGRKLIDKHYYYQTRLNLEPSSLTSSPLRCNLRITAGGNKNKNKRPGLSYIVKLGYNKLL